VTIKYFAYGSNMSLQRLLQRTPSARPLGRYSLPSHELRFHKIGRDGSGKCDAFHTGDPGSVVLGVLYHLAPDEKPLLDRVEGLGNGYRENSITVYSQLGQAEQCFSYFATHTDQSLAPYSWYKQHVLVGAWEADLPATYVSSIECVDASEDPDEHRDAEQRAIHGR
jgi:hypothetical protein